MVIEPKHLTKSELFAKFDTDQNGLNDHEVEKRLKIYGKNSIESGQKKNWFFEFCQEFRDLMVLILIFASLLAYFLGEKTDGSIIMGIVLLNAFIGFIQKYRAEKAIEALKKLVTPHAVVIRNGEKKNIEAKNVVPGDILFINEGDTIAADAVIIQNNNLFTQESILSGESTPVEKWGVDKLKKGDSFQQANHVYMSTQATCGNALALVVSTGFNTDFGKIANLTIETKKDNTPLQKELFTIGKFVGQITLVISIILIGTGIFFQDQTFVDALLFSVSVAVAAVPEGLPATVTIALALGIQRLAKKNAIVKALSSAETLGATTVICSDKTGTLTQNQMTVRQVESLNFSLHVTGEGYSDKGKISVIAGKSDTSRHLKLLGRICRLCNNSNIKKSKNHETAVGDPTEAALLVFTQKLESRHREFRGFERQAEIPFSSERKIMSTIDRKDRENIIHSKGAPEKILARCSHIFHDGKIIKLDEKKKNEILKLNKIMAGDALRVLGLAYKGITQKKKYDETDEKNLIFAGLIGMIDPPRADIKKAIALTRLAGIKIYMVTGDFSVTAAAIAKKIGLISQPDDDNIITGEELQKMGEEELEKILKSEKDYIFARVSPEDKLKIVSALKKNGHVVAVTGDGVNDAPALKRADIGVAMGIAGTDVSKEAANLVLADDSFSTIVIAIKEGRTIYANMKKFIYYIFSANIGELVTIFVAIILAIPMPLTAVLILMVDLGTDVLPALAIGLDPSEPDIMKKPPRPVKSRILSIPFIINFVVSGLYIGVIVTAGYFFILYSGGWQISDGFNVPEILHTRGATVAFVLLVLIQMFHAFNSRSLTNSLFKLGLFSNRYLWGAIMISLLLCISVTELPFLQNLLHTSSLTAFEWLFITVLAASVILVDEIKKIFLRNAPNF